MTFEDACAHLRAAGIPLWRVAAAAADELTRRRVAATGQDYTTALHAVLHDHPVLKTYYVGRT